ncbi:MAG: helix-hairpin-helix domain-containing protein [Candidatus Pacearchaeota archaeon]
MKSFVLLAFMLVLFPAILAGCEKNQIDINSASLSELDDLYGIGEVKAQAIIDSRYFDSVDDLIEVYGIGEKTLEQIKSQGLACVDDENNSEETKEEEIEEIKTENLKSNKEEIPKTPEVILLNPKDIKTEDNVKLDKNDYAFYGLVGFCIFIAFLFFMRKDKFKNEFG